MFRAPGSNRSRTGRCIGLFLALSIALILPEPGRGVGFWLSSSGEVQTTLRLEPELLDLVEGLPEGLRGHFVDAANQVLSNTERSVLDALEQSALAPASVETGPDAALADQVKRARDFLHRTGLRIASGLECEGEDLVSRFYLETEKSIPAWRRLLGLRDECVAAANPDGTGELGLLEKLLVAECRIYGGLSSNSAPLDLIPALSKLDRMALDSACLLKDSESRAEALERHAGYGTRYRILRELGEGCRTLGACFAAKRAILMARVEAHGDLTRGLPDRIREIDADFAKKRTACGVRCIQDALVDLHHLDAEITRRILARQASDARAALARARELLAMADAASNRSLASSWSYARLQESEAAYDEAQQGLDESVVELDRALGLWPRLRVDRTRIDGKQREVAEKIRLVRQELKQLAERGGPKKEVR